MHCNNACNNACNHAAPLSTHNIPSSLHLVSYMWTVAMTESAQPKAASYKGRYVSLANSLAQQAIDSWAHHIPVHRPAT